LQPLSPSQVVGAHYDMGDAGIITAYRGFFTALRERVAEMKKQGRSSDETATTLRNEFRAKYPDLDQHAARAFGRDGDLRRVAVTSFERGAE